MNPLLGTLLLLVFLNASIFGAAQERPNIVLFFIDDMGYADIGPFDADHPTPHLDRLAREGRKFTDFIVTAPVCSSSRASLLTGSLHKRVGVSGAYFPTDDTGLNPDETTLAEICKQQGYATACFGKWHLGHHPKFLPTNQGFDEYFGIPYSNDMWPLHPKYVEFPETTAERKMNFPPLPLIENEQVVDAEMDKKDQQMLTTRITKRAVDFIDRNRKNPFFLYIPHPMVHVPIFVSDKHRGKSGTGLYGDVVMELDWSVGQVIAALERHGLDENTLVIFTSDNGPWIAYGDHAGKTGGLREAKQTVFAGGIRVPTIFWWPGRIPAGTQCDRLASTVDLLPTFAHLIGAALPEVTLDGQDISELMFSDQSVSSPHVAFPLYHYHGQLVGVRNERFKLVYPHDYRSLNGRKGGTGGAPVEYDSLSADYALYDLDADPFETTDVSRKFPRVVRQLEQIAAYYRLTLGDTRVGVEGSETREEGRLKPGEERLAW